MKNRDEGLKELFQALIEGQARTDKSVGTLAVLIGESHGLLETALLNSNKLFEASNARLEAAHLKTEEMVQKYVEAAITREHSNGKSH